MIKDKKVSTRWLIDTGSQITIYSDKTLGPIKRWINLQGANAEQRVPIIDLIIKCYDKDMKIEAANFKAPCNVLGIKEIRKLWPDYLKIKTIKKNFTNLAEVKVEPVKLPKIKPSFTPQYPIKGGMEAITDTLNTLLKEGIVAHTQSFNYNSPVWPVQKPNGKWRFTVDYRRINELSPKMPGSLPDVEGIWLKIRQYAPTWLATIDLSDMFFGIPLHPDSQEITTFTWQQKQYKFLRLPQGYINSPIIAHATLMTTMGDFKLENAEWLSYVDDLLIMGKDKETVGRETKKIIQHLRDQGWTINQDKIQGPAQEVTFLGVQWTATGPKVPEKVIDKILNTETPQNKTQVQQLIGMYGYWRQHIPYMQNIIQPLYEVTKKASTFEWGPRQEEAVKTITQYIQEYRQLSFPTEDSTITIEILFFNGYGSWNIFHKKGEEKEKPMGFYTKRFPWVDTKFSLFEKTIWTTYEAIRTLNTILHNRQVILRTNIPVMDWIKAPGEAWAGLPIEPKVLQWKWYLQNMLGQSKISTAGQIRKQSEEILVQERTGSPIIPIPTCINMKDTNMKPIGRWGTTPYNQNMKQAWFTDGSATTKNNTVTWKAAAFRPSDGKILTQQGTNKSAQHAEVWAALLAARQVKEDKDVAMTIYTDSWAVANGIAIWSAKWKKTNWKINGKPLWSDGAWKELAEISKQVTISVYHVDAHQKKQDDEHKYNNKADELSKITVMITKLKIKKERTIEDIGPLKKTIRTQYKIENPQIERDIHPIEIMNIHKILGHVGTHPLKQWFDQRNIKVNWHMIKSTIHKCELCVNNKKRFTHNRKAPTVQRLGFNYAIQIDFIGPLKNFSNMYACTMVDATTGLGLAKAGPKPDQTLTALTILTWIAQYGTPFIIQSDQGTHFTGKGIQRMARNLGIQWEFHLAYNPTAAGSIERFNGLLKAQLMQYEKEKIHKALLWAIYDLNSRPRLYRKSPLEEALNYNKDINIQKPDDINPIIKDYQCVHRNKKNNSITPAEIIAEGTDNTLWITQGKGDLKLAHIKDIA